MTTPPPKKQSAGEWASGFLTPQVIIVVVAMLGGFLLSVQLHHANTDLHHTTVWLDARYVQCQVHVEEQKRLDEQLDRIDKTMERLERLLTGYANGGN
jgi:hypothetical protein